MNHLSLSLSLASLALLAPATVRADGLGSTVNVGPVSISAVLPYAGAPDTVAAAVASASVLGSMPIGILPPIAIKGGTAPTITNQPASQSVATGASVSFTVAATGTPAPVYQWTKSGRFIRGANSATYTISSASPSDAGSYAVEVYNGAGFVNSKPALLSVAGAGVVTSAPKSLSIATGGTAAFSVTAAGTGLTYQWQFDGIAIPGATSPTFTLANAGPGATGTFTVVISNATAVVAEEVASLSVATNARLVNLSVRGLVGTNGEVLVVGFISSGTGSKTILVRGIGPTLASAYGVSGALTAPVLTLYGQNGAVLASNTAWGGTPALVQAFSQVNAFPLPAASADTAILKSLAPAAYTAHVTGANGASGIALAELYDADSGTPAASLVNVSGRAYVANGTGVLVAGFVITGPSSETILIRGVGPSLKPYGIMNALVHTQVELFNSAGTQITANAGWGNDPWISGTGTQVGAFPLAASSLDSALLVTISPGAYTAQISGASGATGVGMVEIYEVR